MNEQYLMMKNNIRMLGNYLGQTINEVHGAHIFELIEKIRKSAKITKEKVGYIDEIFQSLEKIDNDDIVPVARAFSHFLSLVNLAEQHQSTSRKNLEYINSSRSIDATIDKLLSHNIAPEKILSTINNLLVELVLTAHPTEASRRSLVHKHAEINKCLRKLDYDGLTEQEVNIFKKRLLQLISQTWHTDEIRDNRPTPIEEAKWGIAVVENSLWDAVPRFLRKLDLSLNRNFKRNLAIDFAPLRLSSWIGGDRDGNPNVTAEVTETVIYLSRWKAAELFFRDIHFLTMELSVNICSDEFREKYGDYSEPYRVVIKLLRRKLSLTMEYFRHKVQGKVDVIDINEIILTDEQLWEPLYDCYKSLCDTNMSLVADGLLRDCLSRVKAFGVSLLKLDIRQDSSKHTAAITEITDYIGLGRYEAWNEQRRQEFLITELNNKRPLVPKSWQPSADTAEILNTFKVIAKQPKNIINAYIISMAKAPSDVLLVKLFLSEFGINHNLQVVPLFETLEDLSEAGNIMQTLFDIDWYYKNINNNVMVMIGYSDSAKDAGVIAASWAQYKAQEDLIKLGEKYNVELKLFHGRGGTTGRGGAPAHEALLSQPPGSLKNGLRVTEQGEMVRFKLGFREVAVETFDLYVSAVLEANLLPPPMPKPKWREVMYFLSEFSCARYSEIVKDNSYFMDYFCAVTPINELGKLPLSSRPSKRFASKGIEGLRAIPWMFAWTQNRLLLPMWLGAGNSIKQAIDQGYKEIIDEMCIDWPFFVTRISLLEMVYSKINFNIVEDYEKYLAVNDEMQAFGKKLREQAKQDIDTVLSLNINKKLMENLPWIAESIAQRNIYTDPLNLLQVVLLKRLRNSDLSATSKSKLQKALMVVITGIAAGMRNTG